MKNMIVMTGAMMLLGVGCGDVSPSGESAAPDTRATCLYDFEASVRTGPAAGTNVRGELLLARSTGERFTGTLRPHDGSAALQVGGQIADGAVSLQVRMPDGRMLDGSGRYAGRFESCQLELDGTLTGPGATDSGDWLGRRRTCQRQCNACVRMACESECSGPTANDIVSGGGCIGFLCGTTCNSCLIGAGFSGVCQAQCDCP